jgi:soluble lytic murein transglycosylase-like protein
VRLFPSILIGLMVLAGSMETTASAGDFCFAEAGEIYNISPELLWGIAKHESGLNPYAINRNSNGTYDYGVMQINSSWAKTLGIERWAKLSDPCINIKTGAWILRQCINDYGYGWKAVGCYNSKIPAKGEKYARKVAGTLLADNLLAPRVK